MMEIKGQSTRNWRWSWTQTDCMVAVGFCGYIRGYVEYVMSPPRVPNRVHEAPHLSRSRVRAKKKALLRQQAA